MGSTRGEKRFAYHLFRIGWQAPPATKFDIRGGCAFKEQSLEFLIAHSRLVHNLRQYDLQSREYALLPVLGHGNLFIKTP